MVTVVVHYAHVETATVDKEKISLTSKAFNLTIISHSAMSVTNMDTICYQMS